MNDFFLKNESIIIPEYFLEIKYNPEIIPGSQSPDLNSTGANCQVFAFELLRYNGRRVPDYRSSELWNDDEFSDEVQSMFQPLDILFFNDSRKPYGAHLGVFIGEGKIIHNSRKIGLPVIWTLDDFAKKEEYRILVGGKRFQTR